MQDENAYDSRQMAFYTIEDAARLARTPLALVRAWRRRGIVRPTLRDSDATEGYTFEAVIYLRLLRMLRDRRVPLRKSVTAVRHLRDRFGPPGAGWADARIFFAGQDVFVSRRDEWQTTVASRAGQRVAEMLFDREFACLRQRPDALLVPAQFRRFVEVDPSAPSGLPTLRGTALPTRALHLLRKSGASLTKILESYPWLSPGQLRGALAFESYLDATAPSGS